MHAKERVTKDTVAVICKARENDIIAVEPGKPMISGTTVLCHDQEGVFLKTVIIDSDGNRRFVTHPECADIALAPRCGLSNSRSGKIFPRVESPLLLGGAVQKRPFAYHRSAANRGPEKSPLRDALGRTA